MNPKRPVNKSQPLQTINQKPGREDSSFIGEDERSNTATLQQSAPLENIPEQQHKSNTKTNASYDGVKMQKTRRGKSKEEEDLKILMTEQNLQDIKVCEKYWAETMDQMQEVMKNDGIDNEERLEITQFFNSCMKQNIECLLLNSQKVKPDKYKQNLSGKLPVQINISEEYLKSVDLAQQMLKKAEERVHEQQPQQFSININPQDSSSVTSILLNDGRVISVQDYFEMAYQYNLKKEQDRVRDIEDLVLNTEKRFQDILIDTYPKINTELNEELTKFQLKK